ncbi:MAG TPA: hypothetical protein VII90_04105 [Anaerolineales bacterium]
MYIIKKFSLLAALRTLQAVEQMLNGLIVARPYLPFGALSLAGGFVVGIVITRI